MSLLDKIYEHLKTYKKYNSLEIKYLGKQQELEDKIYECQQLRRQLQIKDNVWDSRVIELEKKLSKRGGKSVSNTKRTSTKLSGKKQDNNK